MMQLFWQARLTISVGPVIFVFPFHSKNMKNDEGVIFCQSVYQGGNFVYIWRIRFVGQCSSVALQSFFRLCCDTIYPRPKEIVVQKSFYFIWNFRCMLMHKIQIMWPLCCSEKKMKIRLSFWWKCAFPGGGSAHMESMGLKWYIAWPSTWSYILHFDVGPTLDAYWNAL